MSLAPGTRLGPYEVQDALGAGGMGEVYRARDTRLERTVAIKVLHSSLVASPDLKLRFEREARAISQLNHPHICTLHDVGSDNGTEFLVMEFLEGETLADRLRKGPFSLDQLVKIGCEIADALDKAHRSGIVHRDLKPGNVMLTKNGAKLLDFGLAKPAAMSAVAASGAAPLLSAAMTSPSPQASPLTSAGALVGTIQYMSPEQLQGTEADARSDIFAFGAVLYEMATGKRAFEGKSQIKVASAILEDEPLPVSSVEPGTPASVERIVRTCLHKDPEQRFQCARDLRLQLQWAAESPVAAAPAAALPAPSKPSHARIALSAAMLAVLAIAAFLLWQRWPDTLSLETYILPPEKGSFTLASDDESGPVVLSPDATRLAFVAIDEHNENRIYIRALNDKQPKAVPGTEHGTYPFWSPDGNSIAFQSGGKLRRVDLNGGPVLDICNVSRFRGGSWRGDTILFAPDVTSGLFRVTPNAGSTPVQVTTLTADQTTNRWPLLLPDGKHFLYLASNHSDPGASGKNGIYFASLDGRENRFLLAAESNAVYAHGHLVWEQGASLLAQSFDPSAGALSGPTTPIAGGIGYNGSTWRAAFDLSNNGFLVYQPGLSSTSGQLLLYGRDGKPTPLPDTSSIMDVRISPDGRKVAYLTRNNHEVWLLDIAGGTRVRFTFSATSDGVVWSADGKYLYYANLGKTSRIMRKAVDGSGAETTVLQASEPVHVSDVSTDGKWMLFEQRSDRVPSTTWIVSTTPGSTPKLLIDEPVGTHSARFSPDGKWIAYSTTETGRSELYLKPAASAGKQQLTSTGAWSSRWSADGKTLYYSSEDGASFALPLSFPGQGLEPGKPVPLFRTPILMPTSFFSTAWDAAPDGKRFVANVSGERADQSHAVLITNWPARLKK